MSGSSDAIPHSEPWVHYTERQRKLLELFKMILLPRALHDESKSHLLYFLQCISTYICNIP